MSWAITAPETRLRSNTSASGSTSITPYRRLAHRSRRNELNGYRLALLAHCRASGALLLCLVRSARRGFRPKPLKPKERTEVTRTATFAEQRDQVNAALAEQAPAEV